jgi:hypothetical protein
MAVDVGIEHVYYLRSEQNHTTPTIQLYMNPASGPRESIVCNCVLMFY